MPPRIITVMSFDSLRDVDRDAIKDAIFDCLNTGESTIPSVTLNPRIAETLIPEALERLGVTAGDVTFETSSAGVRLRRR